MIASYLGLTGNIKPGEKTKLPFVNKIDIDQWHFVCISMETWVLGIPLNKKNGKHKNYCRNWFLKKEIFSLKELSGVTTFIIR
jgi:hypothetical protein